MTGMADRMLRNRDRMLSESAIECRRNADRIRPEYATHVPNQSIRDVLLGDLDECVYRASDIYADLARGLRVAIGNLPDDEPALVRRIEASRALADVGYDSGRIMMEFALVGKEGADKTLGEEAIIEV